MSTEFNVYKRTIDGRGARPNPVTVKAVIGKHSEEKNGAVTQAENYEAVIASVIEVEPPSLMSPLAKDLWREMLPHLTGPQALKIIDLPGFESMCETYGRMCQAREGLSENVIEINGKTRNSLYMWKNAPGGKVLIEHPALATISDCDRRLRQWLIEFGMTPASRATFGRMRPPDQEPAMVDRLEIEKLNPGERDALRVLLERRKRDATPSPGP